MTQASNASKVLIVEARYYDKIADDMVAGATPVFADVGLGIERLDVTGVFEVPAACEMAIQAGLRDPHLQYAGIMALGCVIRGETDHYDHICREASRAIMDLTIRHRYPIGFAILTCENMEQAIVRADPAQKNKGAEAARAVIRMRTIHEQLLGPGHD